MIRVESAETQDYVSGQQGPEGMDTEEMEELSFIPSEVTCATTHAIKKVVSATNLRPV